MIPELGLFALSLALVVSILLGIVPLVGASRGWYRWMALGRTLSLVMFGLTALSYAALTAAFINYDFSVEYVAQTANRSLPLLYRISGVWGGHEGSLLLWVLMLTGWSAAVGISCRGVPRDVVARVLGVLGLVCAGFIAFTLFTSNPFARLVPMPVDGKDLNPLLQDPGLAIHPPMLYMGYVGFAVAFAFAVAALITGRLDGAWARWARPWTNAAWLCLTIGITLGSWWAYHELGWGGWWFWDPVENASFMPWLMGTALIHSLAATDKRGVLKTWTAFLSIATFALSLLGTFMVRSGVLTSVHAFANDPTRGAYLLGFLALVVGAALMLFAINGAKLRSFVRIELVSRESAMVLNNVLLAIAAFTVLLGTLYPLVLEGFGYGRVSVGPPYFDAVFAPLTLPLVFLAGLAGYLRWKRDSLPRLVATLGLIAGISVALTVLAFVLYFREVSLLSAVGVGFSIWVIVASLASFWQRRRSLVRGFVGMTFAHIGIGIFALGVAGVAINSDEREVALKVGEPVQVGEYSFELQGLKQVKGPNYDAARAAVVVTDGGGKTMMLEPEKRFYGSGGNPMTESAVDMTPLRDVYVSIGDNVGGDESWTYRVQSKALIRWIWVGAMIMALGAGIAASDPRYRRARVRQSTRSSVAASTA